MGDITSLVWPTDMAYVWYLIIFWHVNWNLLSLTYNFYESLRYSNLRGTRLFFKLGRNYHLRNKQNHFLLFMGSNHIRNHNKSPESITKKILLIVDELKNDSHDASVFNIAIMATESTRCKEWSQVLCTKRNLFFIKQKSLRHNNSRLYLNKKGNAILSMTYAKHVRDTSVDNITNAW